MKKIISFSLFLILGLTISQFLPALGESYLIAKTLIDILLYISLAFVMINVGREFELNKSRWRSYLKDYFIAMGTAALPWILVALYYIFVLLPIDQSWSFQAWKESFLLSRFAAPTSAGILFTMLAAVGLGSTWIYKKIQILAIFDDLDTILLMIPLQILMIGVKWQMGVIILILSLLLYLGWNYMNRLNIRQQWSYILLYSIIIVATIFAVDYLTAYFFGEQGKIHIEVLLPAFVLGMVMQNGHLDSRAERVATSSISLLFMFLVGLTIPAFIGKYAIIGNGEISSSVSILGSQPMISTGAIILHVIVVTLISNLGKMVPLLFYRDRIIEERLALSIGMFARGEVGAGIIFIALGYNIGGPALVISVLSLVLNLIMTGLFIVWVKKLAFIAERKAKKEIISINYEK